MFVIPSGTYDLYAISCLARRHRLSSHIAGLLRLLLDDFGVRHYSLWPVRVKEMISHSHRYYYYYGPLSALEGRSGDGLSRVTS